MNSPQHDIQLLLHGRETAKANKGSTAAGGAMQSTKTNHRCEKRPVVKPTLAIRSRYLEGKIKTKQSRAKQSELVSRAASKTIPVPPPHYLTSKRATLATAKNTSPYTPHGYFLVVWRIAAPIVGTDRAPALQEHPQARDQLQVEEERRHRIKPYGRQLVSMSRGNA